MTCISHILASAEDEAAGKIIIAVIAVVIWAISALAKQANKSTQKQKERLRQVREAIERAHGQQPKGPVTLDPEIQRRLPPLIPTKSQQNQRRATSAGRPATNYNDMVAQPRATPARPVQARAGSPPFSAKRIPPPSGQGQARPKSSGKRTVQRAPARVISAPPPPQPAPMAEVVLEPAPPAAAATRPTTNVARPAIRPAITAVSVKRWATPATLRQQFILTELFQPPLAMREER